MALPSVADLLVAPQPAAVSPAGRASFAYERPSASLRDLDITRKIVEREGCLEALQQLVRAPAAASDPVLALEAAAGYCYAGPRSVRASRRAPGERVSPLVAPLVLQSVVAQLRDVGVQVVEMIAAWRAGGGYRTFQWRGLNYLLKMATDLDFLAVDAAAAAGLEPLRGLRLERNPLLSPLHLDHPLVAREARRTGVSPEVAAELARLLPDAGSAVARERVLEACKVLANELAAERRRRHLQQLSEQFGGRAGGEHAADDLEPAAAAQQLAPGDLGKHATAGHWSLRPAAARSPSPHLSPSAQAEELAAARELLALAEHELGAVRERLATRQRQLRAATEGRAPPLAPDRRRQLQTRVASLANELKFRAGDVFQRRDALRRRERAARAAAAGAPPRPSRLPSRLEERAGEEDAGVAEAAGPADAHAEEAAAPPPPPPWSLVGLDATELLEQALQRDELRRHELVERFARLRTAASRPRARSAPAAARSRANTSSNSNSSSSSSSSSGHGAALRLLAADDVQRFIDALGLGPASLSAPQQSLGELLRTQGVDGALLSAATDRDLEELGVSRRLHRLRILDAVRAAH